MILFPLVTCPEVGLLNHMIVQVLIFFKGICMLFHNFHSHPQSTSIWNFFLINTTHCDIQLADAYIMNELVISHHASPLHGLATLKFLHLSSHHAFPYFYTLHVWFPPTGSHILSTFSLAISCLFFKIRIQGHFFLNSISHSEAMLPLLE